MSELRIAVILGSTRPGRNGEAVARWVMEQAEGREATYELIDLADHPLPLLDESIPPSQGKYEHEHTRKWAALVAQYDGYVFVTPEYNHSTSGALKNAIDFAYAEWNDKAAAFVGYGSLGAGRAVEHLRGICGELQVAGVRAALNFLLDTDFIDYKEFAPGEHHAPIAQEMFRQLERWAGALKPLRS